MTPTQRKVRARIAGLTSAARQDMSAKAKTGQDGLRRRFEQEADPEGVLPPEERRRRGDLLRRAHLQRIAYRRSK